jgi:uncharacterized protein
MEAIFIPRLTKAPERTETIAIKTFLKDLTTLTPIQGWLRVTHQGNYLEVSAETETIITLSCPRCLQQFNYRLSIAPTELIWLNEDAIEPEETLFDRDLTMDDLVESLPPNGYFEPDTWLYEQLSLEIPQRQLCDEACPGIEVSPDDLSDRLVDRRWASLESLKGKLSN